MYTSTKFKIFFAISIFFFITACNSSDKNDKLQDKPKDTVIADVPAPPVKNPPSVEMKATTQKCFSNEGLKYKIVVTMSFLETTVVGSVTSEEMGSGQKQTTPFEGTLSGDAITVKFKGTPPVMGDASEWTSKLWTIKNKSGKEKLHIIFNAKSYETNKWTDTDYEFEALDCK